jgi:hypothetical protein
VTLDQTALTHGIGYARHASAGFGTMTPLHAPDISPLFKADAVNVAVSASKDGKLRAVCPAPMRRNAMAIRLSAEVR